MPGYGFNRSHAACYAMVAYETAYLKANYPTAFMAALLAADQQNSDRVAIEIEECSRMGIEVRPPDINQSFDSFTVVDEKLVDHPTIRFGLLAIKNVGGHIAKVIKDERKRGGPYRDMSDFLRRINDKDLNRKSLESLIKAGAFDSWLDRGQLLENIDILLKYNKEVNQNSLNGQHSLFAGVDGLEDLPLSLKPAPPADRQVKLSWERELLGMYITEHPFIDYRRELKSIIVPLKDLAAKTHGEVVNIGGMIISSKKVITRENQSMLFVKIEDDTGSLEVIVFPKLLETTRDVWQEGRPILCRGKISDKDNERKVVVDKAIVLNLDNLSAYLNSFRQSVGRLKSMKPGFLAVKSIPHKVRSSDATLKSPEAVNLILQRPISQGQLIKLKEVLLHHPGPHQVYLEVLINGAKQKIATGVQVECGPELSAELQAEFAEVVKF